MRITKLQIPVADTTGDATLYTTGAVNGIVRAVQYIKSTGVALSATAELDIQTEENAVPILGSMAVGSASFYKIPKVATTVVNTTNGAVTASEFIPVANERIKLTITNTSSTAAEGTFNIYVEGTASD